MKNEGKHKSGLLIVATACLCTLLCSPILVTGQTSKQLRQTGPFDGVALSFSGNAIITQASEYNVEIEADKKDLDIIVTEISGNTLVLRTKNGEWRDLGEVKIFISMPEITRLSVSGSGDIRCESPVKTNEIKTSVSGSGSISMHHLESSEVHAEITGSGDIKLAGNNSDQSTLETEITGSGSFKGENLVIGKADVTITGSGSATVNVLKELETNITGSGSVLYKGNPLINANATGSGRTKAIN